VVEEMQAMMFNILVKNKTQREMLTLVHLLAPNYEKIAGRALAFYMGGNWSTSRIALMNELEQLGWVTSHRVPVSAGAKKWHWHYALTEQGKGAMEEFKMLAKHGNVVTYTIPMFESV